jgi:hypothetical protein
MKTKIMVKTVATGKPEMVNSKVKFEIRFEIRVLIYN